MPKSNILKLNRGENLNFHLLFILTQSLYLKKIEINKHKVCGYSLFTHYLLNTTKNKHDNYRSEDCMKNF